MKTDTEVLDRDEDEIVEDLEQEDEIVDENDDEDITDEDDDEESEDDEDEEEAEFSVSFGDETDEDEEEADKGNRTIKLLRKQVRKSRKRIKELERQIEQVNDQPTDEIPSLPAKPKHDQFEDAEDFSTALDNWYELKEKHDEAAKRAEEKNSKIADQWNKKVAAYNQGRDAIEVEDFSDMESLIEDTLSPNQQAMIVSGAQDPALLIYALGKNPKKAEELAALTDPVEFAFAAARMETQLKTSKRKRAPAPERRVRGRSGTTSTDNQLERLEKEAEKTGDRSKVVAYKRQLRKKQG